jgi:hypothetical protein
VGLQPPPQNLPPARCVCRGALAANVALPRLSIEAADAAEVESALGRHLLILNYCYRSDPKRDRNDLDVLALRRRFVLRLSASEDFSLWDAATFVLQRR